MELLENKILLFSFLVFFYNVAIFTFVDTLLENRRIKKWMMWILYTFNTVFFINLFISSNRNTTDHYIIIIICMFVELILLYKETILSILFITLACTIHIMIIRAVSLGIFALFLELSPYEVNQGAYALDSLNITLALLVLACVLVKIFIPPRAVKIINQHKEQLLFMTSWLIFSNGYFLFNSLFFSSPKTEVLIKYNIIAVSLTMLFALYTVLLFTIKIGKLLNYKEKSDFLENAVEDEKQFKNTVIEQAIVGLEVNLTENKVVSSFGKAFDNSENTTGRYSDLVFTSLPYRVHKDDLEMVLHFMSITTLLDKYCKGEVDLSLEYRAMLHGSTDYIWIKAFFTLYKSSKTDSVMAFTYAKDIDAEKQLALEMKSRSERDTLTGLYNHGMTKQLVNEFIHEETQIPCKGALLIVDIDNFKLINDNFGHGFGDEVLRDISKQLTSVFRCDNNINSVRREDDIVGRIGGDEFMVFVKTSDVKGLTARTSRICELLKKTYTTADGKDITISASVGIAVVKDKDDDFKSLYAKADVALYNSKRKGKNCFSFYNGESFQGYKADR